MTSNVDVYSKCIKGIQEEYLINESVAYIYRNLQQEDGENYSHDDQLHDGLLCYKDKVYLVPTSFHIPKLLHKMHLAMLKTYDNLSKRFHWKEIWRKFVCDGVFLLSKE